VSDVPPGLAAFASSDIAPVTLLPPETTGRKIPYPSVQPRRVCATSQSPELGTRICPDITASVTKGNHDMALMVVYGNQAFL